MIALKIYRSNSLAYVGFVNIAYGNDFAPGEG
jgi:hypothetical protein